MSVSSALEELKKCAGSQFDPFIVSEFLHMVKENPIYMAESADSVANHSSKDAPSSTMTTVENKTQSHSVHPVPYSRYLLNESMRIVSIDENFEKLTGYTQEDILQNTIYQVDLIP